MLFIKSDGHFLDWCIFLCGRACYGNRQEMDGRCVYSPGPVSDVQETFGPLSDAKNKLEQVTKISAQQVKEIRILPSEDTGKQRKHSLVKELQTIKDSTAIANVCASLRKSTKVTDGLVKLPE